MLIFLLSCLCKRCTVLFVVALSLLAPSSLTVRGRPSLTSCLVRSNAHITCIQSSHSHTHVCMNTKTHIYKRTYKHTHLCTHIHIHVYQGGSRKRRGTSDGARHGPPSPYRPVKKSRYTNISTAGHVDEGRRDGSHGHPQRGGGGGGGRPWESRQD